MVKTVKEAKKKYLTWAKAGRRYEETHKGPEMPVSKEFRGIAGGKKEKVEITEFTKEFAHLPLEKEPIGLPVRQPGLTPGMIIPYDLEVHGGLIPKQSLETEEEYERRADRIMKEVKTTKYIPMIHFAPDIKGKDKTLEEVLKELEDKAINRMVESALDVKTKVTFTPVPRRISKETKKDVSKGFKGQIKIGEAMGIALPKGKVKAGVKAVAMRDPSLAPKIPFRKFKSQIKIEAIQKATKDKARRKKIYAEQHPKKVKIPEVIEKGMIKYTTRTGKTAYRKRSGYHTKKLKQDK